MFEIGDAVRIREDAWPGSFESDDVYARGKIATVYDVLQKLDDGDTLYHVMLNNGLEVFPMGSELEVPNLDEVRCPHCLTPFFEGEEECECDEAQIQQAIKLAHEGMTTDGEHHKQWYLEEIARVLGDNVGILHEPGIPP